MKPLQNVQARPEPREVDCQLARQPARGPAYAPPQVVTYRGQDVLQELGPAQACSFNHSVLICP